MNYLSKTWLGCLFVAVMLFVAVSMSQANTIGITFDKVIDDVSWGGIANLQGNLTEDVLAELDVQLQGGDQIKGRYGLEVGISAISVFHYGNIKGYSLDGIGSELDIGAKGTINIGGLDVSVGLFARNASEFAGRTAQSILVDENGFDPSGLPPGLGELSPPPTGLKIHPGASANLLLETAFDKGGIGITARLMPQVTGEDRAHQGLLIAKKSLQLTDIWNLDLGGELAFQLHDDSIDYETAAIAALTIDF